MEEKKVKEMVGQLTDITFPIAKNGKEYAKVKINGQICNWFNEKDVPKFKNSIASKELREGDTVKVFFTENPNPMKEGSVFRNINSLGKVEQYQAQTVPEGTPLKPGEGLKKLLNGAEFGLACKLAMMRLQHKEGLPEEEYKKKVITIFKWNAEIKKELER